MVKLISDPFNTMGFYYVDKVSTTSGNQGKLEGIFPVREKLGNLAFLKKNQEKSGNFDDTIYFHGCRERITAGCVGLRYLYS